MDVVQCLNGFQLDDQRLFDQQIGEVFADLRASVMNREPRLLINRDTSLPQFRRQAYS